MKKWLAMMVLCLVWGISSAQEVIYSPYEKFDFRNGDQQVVGRIGQGLFCYRSDLNGHYLDIFDDSMNRTATIILDFLPKKVLHASFTTYPDKAVMLYQVSENNRTIQYAVILDEFGRMKKRPVKLGELRGGVFGQHRSFFSRVISEDKMHILTYSVTTRGNKLHFSGTWINADGEIVKKGQAEFKSSGAISAGSALLDNNGTLYLCAYSPSGPRNFAEFLSLLRLEPGSNTFRETSFPLGGQYATGSYIRMDPVSNRIYLGGFYSDRKNGNHDGVLFGWYDIQSSTFSNHRMIRFAQDLRQPAGERNNRRAFNDFQVRNLIVKNDGGFVMIAESFFTTTRNSAYSPGWGYYSMYYYGPYMAPSVREYYYNDIMVLSYDGEGNMEWQTFVRKDQYSQEDGGVFSSFALLNTGGSLGFLFNDYNSNHSRIQLASVDGEGKTALRMMAAGTPQDPDWIPRAGKQTGPREMIIPCLNRKQLCYAKIIF